LGGRPRSGISSGGRGDRGEGPRELGRVEAGLFQIIVSPYSDVVHAVTDRCREGAAAMTEVARTLRTAADTYDEEDLSSAHKIRNLY
jgi:hypothetical protein